MQAEAVFYSWQSDIPRHLNCGFIEDALKKALNGGFELDWATRNRGGAADIPAAILEKIKDSAFAVFDVTPIARSESGKALPNPNVLVELGYAGREIGWGRSVMVMNVASYDLEDLPFDIRFRRCLTYNSDKHPPDVLAQKLKYLIKEMRNEQHLAEDEARARLTPGCIQQIIEIPKGQGYFSAQNPNSPEILRLLDLRLIRADYNLKQNLYAYHWTPLGRRVRNRCFAELGQGT